MQFLVRQVHTPAHCPKERGGSKTLYDPGAPVKLERVLGDFPHHTVYYLVEAERINDVQKLLDPGAAHCTSEVIPVSEESITR
ncbi:MAG: hypothetical protein WDA27_07685 [Actinomycetota bacterium]